MTIHAASSPDTPLRVSPTARPLSAKRHASPPFVEIGGGHHVRVRDWGEGQPIVLLAGWAMDSRIWGETMMRLNAHGLRTIATDRRGHGASTDPGHVSYDALAEDLAAVLEGLDLTGAALVCHSGAAGEAIRYLSRYGSGRISHLVLAGATGPRMLAAGPDAIGLTPDMATALADQIATDLASWIDANIEPFAPGHGSRIGQWMGSMALDCSRRILVDFQLEIAMADLEAEAAALDLPTTIIHGDRDVSAPLALTGERYAALIQRADLVVYEGAAHGLMITHTARLADDIAQRVRA